MGRILKVFFIFIVFLFSFFALQSALNLTPEANAQACTTCGGVCGPGCGGAWCCSMCWPVPCRLYLSQYSVQYTWQYSTQRTCAVTCTTCINGSQTCTTSSCTTYNIGCTVTQPGQQRTVEQCTLVGGSPQWVPISQSCVDNSTCTALAPTPAPTPPPVYCTSGRSCQSCGAACGTALADCTYTQPQPCIPQQAPGVACGNCPSQAQSCVANRCVNNATITGNIFVDGNANALKDAGESNYTGAITVNSSSGATATVIAGLYTLTLAPGTSYTITYANPPTGAGGYSITYPLSGPPPFFNVALGNPCSTGGSNSASCDAQGNISNLNFGINNNRPWFQCQGQDCRIDSGFISKVPTTAVGGAYASIAGSGGTPGLVFSGSSSPDFGQGQASSTGWVAGGLSYPENYSPIRVGGQIKTSYNFLTARAAQGNITIADISPYCTGGLGNCTLSAGIPHGIYRANGNLSLNAFNFPANQDYVILVNGDLTINGRITVPVGSTAIFSSTGNINVVTSLGEAASSSSPTIQGVYSADRNFVVSGTNNCTIGADLRLNVAGTVITNAGAGGGAFQNNRDLCGQDAFYPTVQFQERADFILNTPAFLKVPNFTYQEIAP